MSDSAVLQASCSSYRYYSFDIRAMLGTFRKCYAPLDEPQAQCLLTLVGERVPRQLYADDHRLAKYRFDAVKHFILQRLIGVVVSDMLLSEGDSDNGMNIYLQLEVLQKAIVKGENQEQSKRMIICITEREFAKSLQTSGVRLPGKERIETPSPAW